MMKTEMRVKGGEEQKEGMRERERARERQGILHCQL